MDADTKDTITISIKFKDGSIGNINYYSNGNPKYSKENIEIFTGNKILKIENFIKLSGYGWNNFKSKKLWTQDKGHKKAIEEFIFAINNKTFSPITFQDLASVTRLSIEISNKIFGIKDH